MSDPLKDELLSGHGRLRTLMGRMADAMAAAASPDGRVALARLRWSLTCEVLSHLDLEDRVAFARLAHDGCADVAAVGRHFHETLAPLYADYQHHLTRWQGMVSDDDLAEYVADAKALLDRLAQRMDEEERMMYPLLEEQERRDSFRPVQAF